jgi:DNA-binding transcriptional LysR family regulator
MQLEIFVAVVEEGTMRRASNRVFRSQPAVSMSIRKIEDEVGMPLFVRAKHHRLLTEAGEILYRFACKLLNLRQEALLALGNARSCLAHKEKPKKVGV